MKKQKGFTLIELVVVMVILAIMAAYAIPKFYDFRTQANVAAVNGMVGAISSAMVTAHGAAIASGQTGSSAGTISMEGSNNVAVVNGYPTAVGIVAAVNTSGFTVSQNSTTGGADFQLTIASGTCKASYVPASSATVPPVVSSTISGC
jgi:MSHA pilin protein MshA